MQNSFVLNGKEGITIWSKDTPVVDSSPGIILDPDYGGTILFRKEGIEVPTDFKSIFEKVHASQNYDYFSFHDSSTGASALVHLEVLRHIVRDALMESMIKDGLEESSDIPMQDNMVQDIALEYLNLK